MERGRALFLAETSTTHFYQIRNVTQVGIDDTDNELVLLAVGTTKQIYHIDNDGQPLCGMDAETFRRVAIETVPWHTPCKMCAAAPFGGHPRDLEFLP